MEWTSAAITEVFITTLAVSGLGIAAVLALIYILGVFFRAMRTQLVPRLPAPRNGFGVGPIVPGPM